MTSYRTSIVIYGFCVMKDSITEEQLKVIEMIPLDWILNTHRRYYIIIPKSFKNLGHIYHGCRYANSVLLNDLIKYKYVSEDTFNFSEDLILKIKSYAQNLDIKEKEIGGSVIDLDRRWIMFSNIKIKKLERSMLYKNTPVYIARVLSITIPQKDQKDPKEFKLVPKKLHSISKKSTTGRQFVNKTNFALSYLFPLSLYFIKKNITI